MKGGEKVIPGKGASKIRCGQERETGQPKEGRSFPGGSQREQATRGLGGGSCQTEELNKNVGL